TGSARFSAETGGVRDEALGKFFLFQNLVVVKTIERYLGGRNEVELVIFIGDFEQLLFKLRKLTGTEHDLRSDEVRDHPHLKSIFQMDVDHVVDQCPFETSSQIAVGGPTASRNFRATLKVEQFKSFVELDMILKREGKLPFFSNRLDTD